MTQYIDTQATLGHLGALWQEATVIWLSGGWAMLAIAVTAVLMFGLGLNIFIRLSGKGFASVRESKWRRWIDNPQERRGPIGEMLTFVTGGMSIKDAATRFEELGITEVAPFERDLRVMKICVGTAPLLGLLGTVTGMLATFSALATGSGGEKTMGMVAGGISEALVTTETGLVIALAGLFAQYQLARKHDRYKTFLAHLQTVCTQKLHRKIHAQEAFVGTATVGEAFVADMPEPVPATHTPPQPRRTPEPQKEAARAEAPAPENAAVEKETVRSA